MTERRREMVFGYLVDDIESDISSTPIPNLIPNPDLIPPTTTNATMAFFSTPSTLCSEPSDSHHGLCHPCQNIEKHGSPQEHFVCEDCADKTHKSIEATQPNLIKSPLLPLCPLCTTTVAWKEQPYAFFWNSCSCPIANPTSAGSKWRVSKGHAKWLCAECRVEELETVQMKCSVEDEEFRRGIVEVDVVNGKPTIAIMGRLCFCLRHLGGNGSDPLQGCAWRCAACYRYQHDGVPADFFNNNRHVGPSAQHNNYHAGPSTQNNNPHQQNMS